jgi:hypothetical protein
MATPRMYDPIKMYRGYAPDTITTLYTAPSDASGLRAIVKSIIICNVTDVAVHLALHDVADATTATAANRFFDNYIPARQTVTLGLSDVLEPEDFLAAVASIEDSITLNISGQVEQAP